MSIEIKNYGNVENVIVAEFGYGTMRVTNGIAKDGTYKGLYLADNKEPKKIGEIGDFAPTTDEFKPKIAIVFHNEKSFSVFEEFVKNIRQEYDNSKTSKNENLTKI